MLLKHVIIIEDGDNVIFIATSPCAKQCYRKSEKLTIVKSKLAKYLFEIKNLVELLLVDGRQMQL